MRPEIPAREHSEGFGVVGYPIVMYFQRDDREERIGGIAEGVEARVGGRVRVVAEAVHLPALIIGSWKGYCRRDSQKRGAKHP